MYKTNGYVITGGPGAGKTTLLLALGKAGYGIIPEDARRIIREQLATNGNGLPWKNRSSFFHLMWAAAASRYLSFPASGPPCFFDRGMVDCLCYAKMAGLPLPGAIEQMARNFRYNQKVLLLPPWRSIYHNDPERKQSWQEAVLTYEQMKAIYKQYGYEILLLPRVPVEERVAFVQQRLFV